MKNDDLGSTITIVGILLRMLGVKVTSGSVRETLQSYSEEISFQSISDALGKWNVPNASYHITRDQLSLLPFPFLAKMQKGAFFIIVRQIDDKNVYFTTPSRSDKMPLNEFLDAFSGFVMIAEPDERSGEPAYTRKRIHQWWGQVQVPVLSLALAGILLSTQWIIPGLFTGLLVYPVWTVLLVQLAGLAVTCILWLESTHSNNYFVKKFCGTDKLNCQSILSSRGASILWGLSNWSEAGFLYFLFSSSLILFHGHSPQVLRLLAWLNWLVLPYTAWSLYYQYAIARQWCLFCCLTLSVLWASAILLSRYLTSGTPLTFTDWMGVVACLLITFVWVLSVKNIVLRRQQTSALTGQLNKFVNNGHIFNTLLSSGTRHILLDPSYTLNLLEETSDNVLTMVLNPFCDSCVNVYKEIETWLEKSPNINVRLILLIHSQLPEEGMQVTRHMINIYLNDKATFRKAFRNWIYVKNASGWLRKWANVCPCYHDGKVDRIIFSHQEWCEKEQIIHSPKLLLNDTELPDIYDMNMVSAFLN